MNEIDGMQREMGTMAHKAPPADLTMNPRLWGKGPEQYNASVTDPRDHPLHSVLMEVIEQVNTGKGVRHGGDKTRFYDQPWLHYAKLHGRGFLTGQAAKKLEEAASRGLTNEAFEREVMGAIAYIGMAILFERGAK